MHRIVLTLTPTYNSTPPFCKIFFNNKLSLDCKLTQEKIISYDTDRVDFLEIKIVRSGRNKDVVLNDKDNAVTLKHIEINKIKIPTNIGTFQTHDNLYIEEKQTNTNIFNLNGTYFLKIPLLTLKGENTFSLPSHRDIDVGFFGASMTVWNFAKGKPPIIDGKNYVEIFQEKHKRKKIINFAKHGQTNQEIFESVKSFFKNKNKAKIIIVQLISVVGRQIKNVNTKELTRYQIWQPSGTDNNTIDEFTGTHPKQITDYFAYLDVKPIIALQIPEFMELIELSRKNDCKIYFTTYFKDEYLCYNTVFPANMAPYFEIDRNEKYVVDNGLHATVKEQETFANKLLTFCEKLL